VGPQAVKSRSLGEHRLPCETRTDFSQPARFCSCSRQLLRATYCSPWRLETRHLQIVWVMGALYIKCLQQSERLRTGRSRGAHGLVLAGMKQHVGVPVKSRSLGEHWGEREVRASVR
jgi:hypothetical protein